MKNINYLSLRKIGDLVKSIASFEIDPNLSRLFAYQTVNEKNETIICIKLANEDYTKEDSFVVSKIGD